MTKTMTALAAVFASAVLSASAASAQTATTAALDAAYSAATELLPPGAKPGECYARVFIPATTKRVAKEVLVNEASEKLEVIPAQYEEAQETVEVESATETLEIVPAKFEMRDKVIVVEPEKEVKEVIPAVYETIKETVQVRAAYQAWKRGTGPIQRYDEATGEIMCLVTVPAEFETVEKQVVKTPARVVTKTIPAVTKVVKHKVMVEGPSTRKVVVPAKFDTVTVKKMVEPAKVTTIKLPAQYKTVYETVKDVEGRMEWRSILCNENVSEDLIKRLQVALKEAGYDPKGVDGALGRGTMEAVKAYQKANGLAQGQVTIEMLEKLKVAVR